MPHAVEVAVPPVSQVTPFRASGALFVDDDQLLVEVKVGGDQVTDALSTFSSRSGVYLPIGELARALDLAITVYPAEQRASGWILQESRTISVELATRTIRINDQTIPMGADQVAFYADDIYVRLDLMEKLLPIGLKYDPRGLILLLKPREALPFQLRLERERRRQEIGGFKDRVSVMKVDTPYLAFTPPSFDISLNGGAGLISPNGTVQYDLRAAGDFGYAAMQMYAGSDQYGRLSDARFTLGRTDTKGHILGPLGGTDAEIGDTFTPSLSLGQRSGGGRGVFFSSGPAALSSVFSHLDLRGELQDGWQVELYINEVLHASQASANQGRYEFLNVPLIYGGNTLRLVFYGPQGQQREDVRHYNFGSGQLDKGQLVINFGAVQVGKNVIPTPPAVGSGGSLPPVVGAGTLRTAASFEYGVTHDVTVVAGLSHYTPILNQTRDVLESGLRTSLAGIAMQLNVAKDLRGGGAESFNFAGQIQGISFLARDSEYQGLFYDEHQRSGVIADALMLRASELRLDWTARFFKVGSGIPMSLDIQRDEKQDGSTLTTAGVRFSVTPGGTFLSSSMGFSQTFSPIGGRNTTLSGEIDASRLIGSGWQARGGLQYEMLPHPQAQALFINIDHALSHNNSLRVSLSQALSSGKATSVQVADTWRLNRASIAITAGVDRGLHDVRVGLQLAFGLVFDPTQGRYRIVRPGAASSGTALIAAFIDSNADGRQQPGEAAVANLAIESQQRPGTTDALGRALLTGLGAGSVARILVKADALDDAYVMPPADIIEILPRPGRVIQIFLGLKPMGELQLRFTLRKPGGESKGVSGLDVQIVSTDNVVVWESRTEYDGTMYAEKLPPGIYSIRIEEGQARRLGLTLEGCAPVTIPAQGGYVGGIEAHVVVRP